MRTLRPTRSIIVLLFLALAPSAPAAEPPAGSWQPGFALPGVDGRITCACAWEGGFAVGGLFTRADSSFVFARDKVWGCLECQDLSRMMSTMFQRKCKRWVPAPRT